METVLERKITADEIKEFNDNGVVALRQVVDEMWQAKLAAAIEKDIETPGPFYHGYDTEEGKFHGNLRLWQHDPDFREFCLHSSLPGLAQQFFNSAKINLLYDQLFVKEPKTNNRTRWHNDQPYWPIRGHQVISFWIAFDSTTLENGALEFIRGSHLWDRWFQPETFGKTTGHGDYERNPDYESIPDIESTRDDYEIVSWDLEPGDAYVFHGMTIHGSPGNLRNDRRRRGYTVRYTGDDVMYDTRPGPNVNLRIPSIADGDPIDSETYPLIFQNGVHL